MDENSKISTRPAEWSSQQTALELPDTLLGGTTAMRQAGTKYLRRGSAESQADYDLRLNSTVLTDAYTRTLNFLTGQVFRKDVVLEDAGESIVGLTENIDNRGNNISVFCQRVFREGLHSGVVFILVDFSRVPTRTGEAGEEFYDAETDTWQPKNMDAAKRLGWRPYWVMIEASRVIDAWSETVNGRPVLAHFRFFEDHVVDSGPWSKKVVKKIRVLEPGMWSLWAKNERGEWVVEDEGTTGHPVIPVAMFRPGEQTGEFTARPSIQGLVDLCEMHWQSSSGHRHLMDWVRRPAWFGVLLGTGDEDIAFGPNRLIQSNSVGSDLKSVGVDVSSVAASREDLQAIESAMALYGLRLLMPRSGATTATQHVLESAESDSALKRWARAFADCIEQAFVFTAMWTGESEAAGVKLNDEFVKIFDADQTRVILEAVAAGIMPKETAFDALRAILPVRDDLDWQEAKAMMEDDQRLSTASPLPAQAAASALLGRTAAPGSTTT